MFKKTDPYSFSVTGPLVVNGPKGDDVPKGTGDPITIGLFVADYQVSHYDDVKLQAGTDPYSSSVIEPGHRVYLLNCSQRIKIYNPDGLLLSPQKASGGPLSYDDYPALFNANVAVAAANPPIKTAPSIQLMGYSPQTVNTQVQTSGTTGTSTGQANSSSSSNTVGSSTSQTNSYGVSVGSFGDAFTASVSAEYSSTSTQDQSATQGSEASRSNNQDASQSAYMSIKDWGSYCLVDPIDDSPTWTFGQEYPWDAIECRQTNGTIYSPNKNQTQLIVPSGMLARLYDGVALYPPSHLSMFGLNFVMKAQWQVTVPDGESDQMDVTHIINYFTASHGLAGGPATVAVYLDSSPTVLEIAGSPLQLQTPVDLGVIALAPIGTAGGSAIIGFIPEKFTILPVVPQQNVAGVAFKVFSAANNLRITDTTAYNLPSCDGIAGFTAAETALTATLTSNVSSLSIRLLFKITDSASNFTFYMKHWKTSAVGIKLTLTINGNTANSLTKYVDAFEAEGGENNLLAIALRNQDISSVDYHDYLKLGLNAIDIAINPIEPISAGAAAVVYQIRAVSIEKE